jgi:hypothetical protein
MMYGSKLTRKEYWMINALVQDVSFIADLHITAITDDHSSCRPLYDTAGCSADWWQTLCIVRS